VAVIMPPEEAAHAPVGWAAGRLCVALRARGVTAVLVNDIAAAPPGAACVLAALAASATGRPVLAAGGLMELYDRVRARSAPGAPAVAA
jgi:hypothetical protein